MDISNDEVHDQNVSYCPVADLSFDQFDNFEDLKLHSSPYQLLVHQT